MTTATTTAALRARVMRLAKQTGCTVTTSPLNNGTGSEVCVEAPPGKHFAMVGIHEVVASDYCSCARERWESVLQDMLGGFEACTEENPCDDWDADGKGCPWWGGGDA